MKRQKAYSLIEMLIVVVITSIVIIVATQLFAHTSRSFSLNTSQLEIDQYAGIAIEKMTRDLQEAKQIEILSDTHLKIFYPQIEDDGSYNRLVLDTNNTIEYYLGDNNGIHDEAGTILYRKTPDSDPRIVCRNVVQLAFNSNDPSSVIVTLKTLNHTNKTDVVCDIVHRAILLRNY